LENYVCVRAFKSRLVPIDQVFALVACFACCSRGDSS